MANKYHGGNGIKGGQTSVTIPIRLLSTAGAAVTGKVYSDLTAYYWRQGGSPTAITLSALAAINSAYSSGGVKEAEATNMKGLYRLDLPDAMLAVGVDWVVLQVQCSGAVDYPVFISLESVGDSETYDRVGAPAGASVSADIAGVQSDTDNIQTRLPAALTGDGNLKADALKLNGATPNNLAAGAQMDLVNAPNATAVTALQSGLATAAKLLSYIKSLARKDFAEDADIGGTYDAATDSLEAVKDSGASAIISDSDMTEIAGRVWDGTYAPTRTLTQAVSNEETTTSSGLVTRYRGATWTLALTGLGSLTTYSKLWFTVKSDPDDADADALLQVAKHASVLGDGLLVLNGAVSGLTAADGAIVIDVAATGDITLTVKPATTTQLEPQNNLAWDVKMLTGAGVVSVLATGTLNILADITRKVS